MDTVLREGLITSVGVGGGKEGSNSFVAGPAAASAIGLGGRAFVAARLVCVGAGGAAVVVCV